MTKRRSKKYKNLEFIKELTPETKGVLIQRETKLVRELAFIRKLLAKPLKKG